MRVLKDGSLWRAKHALDQDFQVNTWEKVARSLLSSDQRIYAIDQEEA